MAVDITPSTLLEFAKTIDSEPQPTSKTRMATVTRIGDDGTPYVKFPDGTETPLAGTVSTLKIGDSVMVSMQSGKLRANANVSDPAASNERMTRTETTALAATKAANAASIAADAAEYDAQRAHEAADNAQSSANDALSAAGLASEAASSAQSSATAANTHANDALAQLSVVEDVIGTVNWVTEHGTYALTQDSQVDDSKVYFTRTGSGTSADPYIYTAVAEPKASDLSTYYELSIDTALSNYVASHLVLTNAGLYVINDANSYKTLLASTGMSVVDPQGHTVVTYGPSTTFASNRDWYIGNASAFIFYDASENTLQIGGTGITIGGKAPADLISESDVTGDYLVGKINLDSTSATISAERVEINGTVIFTAIRDDVKGVADDAVSDLDDYTRGMSYVLTDDVEAQDGVTYYELVSGEYIEADVETGDDVTGLYVYNNSQSLTGRIDGEFGRIEKYVKIEGDVLTLGNKAHPVCTQITSTGMTFYPVIDNDSERVPDYENPIASFEVEDGVGVLRVHRAVIVQELQFGDWKWMPRVNGNLCLKWIGA